MTAAIRTVAFLSAIPPTSFWNRANNLRPAQCTKLLQSPTFHLNFVNVFVDGTGGLQESLYVDGNPVKSTANPDFLQNSAQIPGTNTWVYHISVPPGAHTLQALTPFSAYAVGYRNYDAYAWACQLGLKVIG